MLTRKIKIIDEPDLLRIPINPMPNIKTQYITDSKQLKKKSKRTHTIFNYDIDR